MRWAIRAATGTATRWWPTSPSFSDTTWLDAAGNYHSDQLHVVERYTRTNPDTLMYEATIEDPKVFTRPWKIRMPLRLQKGIQIRGRMRGRREWPPPSRDSAQQGRTVRALI